MTGREQEPFAYSPELQPGSSAAQPSGGSAQPAEAFRASPVQPHYAARSLRVIMWRLGFWLCSLAFSAFISSIWATMPKV